MKKDLKIAMVALALLSLAAPAFAMQMGQPEEIGSVMCVPGGKGEWQFWGETSNTGSQSGVFQKQASFNNGVVTFGQEPQALRFYTGKHSFGGMNTDYLYQYGGPGGAIYSIPSDGSVKLYLVVYYGKGMEYRLYGVRPDGICVQYFNTQELGHNGIGRHFTCKYGEVRAEGDTLVIPYSYDNLETKKISTGAYYFKWDDAAQWFSVDYVNY